MFHNPYLLPHILDYFMNREFADKDEWCCGGYYEEDDEDEEPDNSDFFFANACQICGCMSGPDSENRLFRCSKCQMISYCGKKHQMQHWPSHKKFCKALTITRKKHDVLQASKGRKQEAWKNARLELINLVTMKLKRKLTLHEEKVIKFPRACLICHDVNQYNLVSCTNCPGVSFCQEHRYLRQQSHDEMCPQFKVCYTIELAKLKKKNKPVGKKEKSKAEKNDLKTEPHSREDSDEEDEEEYLDSRAVISVIKEAPIKSLPYFEKPPESMRSFLRILSSINSGNLSVEESFIIADLFTRPLSAFRALEKLDRAEEQNLIIHVIGAKAEDLDAYLFWETLLHFKPKLSSLKVVLFNREFARQILNPKLCRQCIERGKTLDFEMYNLGYKRFLEEKSFSEPSLVIGFKFQVKTEKEALECVSNSVAPFAFTSDFEKEAKGEHRIMKKLLGKLVTCQIFEKNSFPGSTPSLNFETNGVSFEHQFLTIYTDLENQATKRKVNNGTSRMELKKENLAFFQQESFPGQKTQCGKNHIFCCENYKISN